MVLFIYFIAWGCLDFGNAVAARLHVVQDDFPVTSGYKGLVIAVIDTFDTEGGARNGFSGICVQFFNGQFRLLEIFKG